MKSIYISIAFLLSAACAFAKTASDTVRYVKTETGGGSYTGNGRTWATAKSNLQDAINDLHDYLLHNTEGHTTGRIYVAEGTYYPNESTEKGDDGILYTAFKIYEGISLYGGYAGTEETAHDLDPANRALSQRDNNGNADSRTLQWRLAHRSILCGDHTLGNPDNLPATKANPLTWNPAKHSYNATYTGNSYHVVFFATNGFYGNTGRAKDLKTPAIVDGFVVRDGYASNASTQTREHNSFGGGVYMVRGAKLRRCIVQQCAATRSGGGVYMDGGGDMEYCFVSHNLVSGVGIHEGYGGGVSINYDGHVRHSFIGQNAARAGGGLAISRHLADDYPAEAVQQNNIFSPSAASCVVTNNTATSEAGGVLLRFGGTLNHLTIANNHCSGHDIVYDGRHYGRSAGLYIDEEGLVANTVCWGGKADANKDVQFASFHKSGTTVPKKPLVGYCAFSNTDRTVWGNSIKQNIVALEQDNTGTNDAGYYAEFNSPTTTQGVTALPDELNKCNKVIDTPWANWTPKANSQLRARGMQISDYPGNSYFNQADVLHANTTEDYEAGRYIPRTTIGALIPADETLDNATVASQEPGETDNIVTVFVDPNRPAHKATGAVGASWDTPMANLDDAIAYASEQIQGTDNKAQVLVKEGTTTCAGTRSSVYYTGHLQSSSIIMSDNVRVYGGYPKALAGTATQGRNPLATPTRISGDLGEDAYEHNACHIVSFINVAGAVLDGFQLYGGYALPSALYTSQMQSGAGVIVSNYAIDDAHRKNMTGNIVRNCVIANCTADHGAALQIEQSAQSTSGFDIALRMENCIVRNNQAAGAICVRRPSQNANVSLEIDHCTIRGNVGYAVENSGQVDVTITNTAIHANAAKPYSDNADLANNHADVRGINGPYTGSNNMLDQCLGTAPEYCLTYTLGGTGFPKFRNPTKNIGPTHGGDITIYGGTPDFMPTNVNPMVNMAQKTADPGTDISATNTRDYGGRPDIGAVEGTDLPKAGCIIYVTPNGAGAMDGSSWADAIAGNDDYSANQSFRGKKDANNNRYFECEIDAATQKPTGLQWAIDEAFGRALTTETTTAATYHGEGNTAHNPTNTPITVTKRNVDKDKRVQVWVAQGDYTRAGGFFMREGVDVYGGFPASGTPGMNEREPKEYTTSIMTQADGGTTWGPELKSKRDGGAYDFNMLYNASAYTGQRVLTQQLPYYYRNSGWGPNNNWTDLDNDGQAETGPNKVVLGYDIETVWDGFTIKNGRTKYSNQMDGGAGVALRYNGVLRNCVVKNNQNQGPHSRGGGIFCNDGTVENCEIIDNSVEGNNDPYGGGMYLRSGKCFNSIFRGNENTHTGITLNHDGAAVYFEDGSFYNNTVVDNTGSSSLATNTFFKHLQTRIYNTIVYSSDHTTDIYINGGTNNGGQQVYISRCVLNNANGLVTAGQTVLDNTDAGNRIIVAAATNVFKATNDYHLQVSSPAVNAGTDNLGKDSYGKDVALPKQDADYSDRVQDCRVDIGAYELNSATNIGYTEDNTAMTRCFYVTQNGRATGNSSADSPANAACWTKLQKVLDAAGRLKASEPGYQYIVKIAGDPTGNFKYKPRHSYESRYDYQQTDEDPKTWAIVVPHGVELWGGYSDAYTSATDNGFTEANRDILANKTTISGIYQNDDGEDVECYHAITFTNDIFDQNGNLLKETDANGNIRDGKDALAHVEARSIVEGIFVEDGSATGEAKTTGGGIEETRYGGGAIVEGYATVRNCVVQRNTAAEGGGGLYMKEGSIVSGCIVQRNTCESEGGGVFVEEPPLTPEGASQVSQQTYAIVACCTVVENTANRGGGICFDTNVRAHSTLFWENNSNDGEDVAGITNPVVESDIRDIGAYPMSYCAVEGMRLAGLNNIEVPKAMTQGVRFERGHDNAKIGYAHSTPIDDNDQLPDYEFFYPLDYSLLTRAGMDYRMFTAQTTSVYPSVGQTDIAGIGRMKYPDHGFIEIGARAYDGELLKLNPNSIMHRIFVSRKEIIDEGADVLRGSGHALYSQQGSSMKYPLHRFDDALEYVQKVRRYKSTADGSYPFRNDQFEIFLTGGTYYPMRTISGEYTAARGCTFLVPEWVSVVGGLEGTEDYYGETTGSAETFGTGSNAVTLTPRTTADILAARAREDLNNNNLVEPWEFQEQTILSGEIIDGELVDNAYHVVTCIADENYVGGLPDAATIDQTGAYPENTDNTKPKVNGAPILLDALTIEHGRAMTYSTHAENKQTYYKGGGVCVDGKWTTGKTMERPATETNPHPVGVRNIPLEVFNCQFNDNMGGLGGAIYSDGGLKVFGCSFTQNTAQSSNSSPSTYAGQGGAVCAASYLTLANVLFANNEAKLHDTGNAASGQDKRGWGGAVMLGQNSHLYATNCDFVRNKAVAYPAVYTYNYNAGGSLDASAADKGKQALLTANPHNLINSVFWGNEATSADPEHARVYPFHYNETLHDSIDALWFCAYEDGRGLRPRVSADDQYDYRRFEFPKTVGYYVPMLFTVQQYAPKDENNNTIAIPTGDIDPATGLNRVTGNIVIASDNNAVNGPNFIMPTTQAGTIGHNQSADWMIGRLNSLVDEGWTYLKQESEGTDDYKFVKNADGEWEGSGFYWTTAYKNFHNGQNTTAVPLGDDTYMLYSGDNGPTQGVVMNRISPDPNPTHNKTYIDIGVYEYQHVKLHFLPGETDILWVTQKEKPGAQACDGSTWLRATSDMQRAIETLLASRNDHHKEIRMKEGQYMPQYLLRGNLGFELTTNQGASNTTMPAETTDEFGVLDIRIRGGYSEQVEGEPDARLYPTYLVNSKLTGATDSKMSHLMVIGDMKNRKQAYGSTTDRATNSIVPVILEGLHFVNVKAIPKTDDPGGAAIRYDDQTNKNGDVSGGATPKLTIANCVFALNGMAQHKLSTEYPNADGTAPNPVPTVTIGHGGGTALIKNSLFHSNSGNSLEAHNTKVLNCTFALNGGHIKWNTVAGVTPDCELHNSILWRNDLVATGTRQEMEGTLASGGATYNAWSSAADATNYNDHLDDTNNDVRTGPNFTDPGDPEQVNDGDDAKNTMSLRDFTIGPSKLIVGKADQNQYTTTAGITDITAERDLAGHDRLHGTSLERGAYECMAAIHRVLYVQPDKADDGSTVDGTTWQHSFRAGELQKAIDAAAVYSETYSQTSYVFVKGTADHPTGEDITMRDKVQVYGSLPLTETVLAGADVDNPEIYCDDIRYEREGLASPNATPTKVNSLTAGVNVAEAHCDGLDISGDVSLCNGKAVLTSSIVRGNTTLSNGLIYNSLLRGDVNLTSAGHILNCTILGTYTGDKNSATNTTYYGAIYKDNIVDHHNYFTPYIVAPYMDLPDRTDPNVPDRAFQLNECASTFLNHSDNMTPLTDYTSYYDFTKDRDLLGNPRLLWGKVDMGCFELWSTWGNETGQLDANRTQTSYGGHHYPHEGSVVYLPGGSLVCKPGDFTAANPLRPAFVLISEKSAGNRGKLYGNGNQIELDHVAVDRNISGKALVAVPFDWKISDMKQVGLWRSADDIVKIWQDGSNGTVSRYDSEARSAYNYRAVETNSTLWKPYAADAVIPANQGFLVEANGWRRFEAAGTKVYVEQANTAKKTVELTQYDNRTAAHPAHFTVKENMGWNLKGTPWLISNYPTKDNVGVPRLLYTMGSDGSFTAVKSWETDKSGETVHEVSPGFAYFTQTAIIGDHEDLSFNIVYSGAPTSNAAPRPLTVSIESQWGADKVELDGKWAEAADLSDLSENPEADATDEFAFRFGLDGLKWLAMNDSLPQLAVVDEGGTWLADAGAVPEGRELPLAVVARFPGEYTFALSGTAATDNFHAILRDRLTGAATDIALDSYTAAIAAPGTIADRFTLTIGAAKERMASPDIRIYGAKGKVVATGLPEGACLDIYTYDGILRARAAATGRARCEQTVPSGVYIARAAGKAVKVVVR